MSPAKEAPGFRKGLTTPATPTAFSLFDRRSPDLLDQLVYGRSDAIFDIAVPAERRAAIFKQERAPFVAPFFPDAPGRDIRNHVVGISADPRAGTKFQFESQCVIDDGFRTHANDQRVLAQPPCMNRIRIACGE